jgi:predicted Rossmann fold nucleotide-binding protein DprA/Smf involved in DNA uptake
LAEEPAGADDLGHVTGLDAASLAMALTELELAGAASEADGVWRGVRPQG